MEIRRNLWMFIENLNINLKSPGVAIFGAHQKDNLYFFETFYVNLEPSGTFSSPSKPGLSKFRGKWSCKGNEITLTRFKYGFSEIESYIGIYSPLNNGTIYGIFTFGRIEPFYVGTFKMTHTMSSFNPITKNIDINENKTIFKAKSFVGNWQLLFKGETSFSTYNIRLYRNLTWESTNYIGNQSKLAGYWNLYNESVDTTTGISEMVINFGYGFDVLVMFLQIHMGHI